MVKHSNNRFTSTHLVIGTSLWDKDLFISLGLNKVKFLTDNLPHYRLNEAFMAFGAVGVAYNVVTRFVLLNGVGVLI
jgi:hypothetical protein